MQKQPNLATILLVEDNVDDYEATARSFKEAHLDNPLHWCKNGKDAMDYLKREGKYASGAAIDIPGLVLLDLNMPGIDGRKVLALIKQDNGLKKIPIVILTTSSDEKDVEKCYELGASTYIQKPVDFEGLVEAISRIKDYWFGIALLPRESQYE
jgi:two-component system, response regulator